SSYISSPLIAALRKHAPPPARIFEIGCGNGAMARTLGALGYSVTGIDPSPSGIAIARQFESDQLHFEVASTNDDLGARYGTFPVVISLEVIEHCHSAREFIAAFRSVLAPGGIGFISTPYHGYLKNLAIAVSGRFDRHFNP